jgi:predicted Zn-dependent protease
MVEALQKTGQDAEAVSFLQQRTKQWPDVPRLYQLQAQSQERLGQKAAARRTMATYYELTGALPTAVEQLQQARGMTKDFYLQSELDVQIRTLKERLKADRELLERFKS